ncbi:peptidoglycan DD-metalloendopeptidase family protein [Macrococcus capreoli]|uniref:peptidoglycan DD-metalloendopeptidase family protein n=1 Tax=Macrococcus capreoli TaxID=2982690 RepID=UPI0021D58856|nr:peptidoglycan DD-metalloendopeptidase family protein [Macrococcus sp. TMW 2.2395]MCU7557252.1 peptidoglycan DD-metalloendopeptidase family protein [Macrococcus sp. TMW 2.2395]
MPIGSTPLGNMAIEVNLDDSKLRQSTTNMRALMKSVNAEFQANMSAVKRTGSEYDILATRTEGLGKKFQAQEKIVKSLEEAYEKARIEAEKQGASQQQIRAMESKRAQLLKEKASLNDLSSALSKAQDEQNQMIENNRRLETSFGKLEAKIKETGEKLKGFGSKMTDLGKNLSMSVSAPIIGLGTVALDAAAESEATSSQFKQVFGNLEDEATKSLNNISKTTGLMPNTLKDSYVQMAAFAKTTGVDTKGALDLTSRATLAAADSAAFYDRSISEVTENLQSYLKGNYENDAALGISSTETTRNAKANELYGKSFQKLSEEQKQLTLLKMVEDGNKLSGALGQASRESDTLATQTSNVKTAFKDFLAEIGKPILPMAVQALKSLANLGKDVANKFVGMSDLGKKLTLGFVGFVAIAPIVLMAVGGIATGLGALSTLGAPILIAVAALTALGVGFTIAYKKSETFRNIVNGAMAGVGRAFNAIKGTIKGVFQLFQGNNKGGTLTLNKFFSPTLVSGIKTTVNVIKSTFTNMSKAVGKVFKDIGRELSTFWNQNGKMIVQALKNMMAVVRPILSILGKLFSVTLKVAFVILKEVVVGTFKAIVGVIKGAINVITGIIQVFSALFTGNWRKLFQGLWRITKGIIEIIWHGINLMFFGRIIKGGLAFAKGFTRIFPTLWNGIKGIFTKSASSIYKFVTETWSKLHRTSTSVLTNMWKSIVRILSNLFANFRSTFNNIWTKTKEVFRAIYEFVPNMISRMKDRALNGLRRMKDGLFNLMDGMKKKVADSFGNMVDGARQLPSKLGNAISNGKDKAVQGVRNLGSSMIGKLGGVVNGTIGGINTVMSKLGVDKKIGEWTPPKFSKGTKNGALAQDSLITVGDFGVGNGIGKRELVQFPNGKMHLFENETTLPAPAGTIVYSNKQTEHLLGTRPLRFSTGTGAGGFFGDLGKSIINGIGDVMEWLSEPGEFVEKMIAGVLKKTGFGNLSNFALDFAKGGFNKIKEAVLSFITKTFEENSGGDGIGGVLDPALINYHFGHTAAYTAATGRPFHEGVDFPFVYQEVGTPMSGTLRRQSFMSGGYGNWVKVVAGAVELIFAHLKDFSRSPKDGTHVKAGDIVGLTGNTGFSTGPHLHFGRRVNGRDVDPEPWLKQLKASGKLKASGGSNYPQGSGAAYTRSVIKKAQSILGGQFNNSFVTDAMMKLAWRESNYNPNVVNNWDVNAQNGDPSRGLFQIIGSTFRANALPGHSNFNSPLDQAISAMRYIMNRYGSMGLHGAFNRAANYAYKTGGIATHPQIASLAEEGWEEIIIPTKPSRHNDAMKLLAYTAMKIMPKERGGKDLGNKIPNVSLKNDNQGESELIKLMMKMISKQDEQIRELKEQTKAIQNDRYTVVEANGREIAKVTHEYHDEMKARKRTFQPRTAI